MAERVGFEPTAPCGVTGFQDQLLKPLGHLSIMVYYSRFYDNVQQLNVMSLEHYTLLSRDQKGWPYASLFHVS